MLVVESNRLLVRDLLVFFPSRHELEQLEQQTAANCILRVCQTAALLERTTKMVARNVFRTTCVNLTEELQDIFEQMDRKSCRYEIRRAEKMLDRVQFRRDKSVEARNGFLQLYNGFVSLKGYEGALSRTRLDQYLQVSDLWLLELDGELVCGHVVAPDENARRARLIFSATSRLRTAEDAKATGALNRYLHWQELQTYKADGLVSYDFGGIGDGTSSIARFKLSFGGTIAQENSYVFCGILGRVAYAAHDTWVRRNTAKPKGSI